jgi:hypothetical protein
VSVDTRIQQTYPRILLYNMSGHAEKNRFIHKLDVSCKVTLNQVSHRRRRLEEKTVIVQSGWSKS